MTGKLPKSWCETLRDGERGFATAAERLRDSDHPEWADHAGAPLEAARPPASVHEIVDLGHECYDDVDESGTVTAALHRGWISLEDAPDRRRPGQCAGGRQTGGERRGLAVRRRRSSKISAPGSAA